MSPDNILAKLWNTAVRHRESSKSCVVFSTSQVLCNQNKRLWGSVVLQIPAHIVSFVCSALLLILQRDGEVVKWLSKERHTDVVLACFSLHFAEVLCCCSVCVPGLLHFWEWVASVNITHADVSDIHWAAISWAIGVAIQSEWNNDTVWIFNHHSKENQLQCSTDRAHGAKVTKHH